MTRDPCPVARLKEKQMKVKDYKDLKEDINHEFRMLVNLINKI